MPWNGSGVFTSDPAGYPAVGGTTILASFYNAAMVDIASVGFGNCITRDGQGKPSAQIDWNAQNLTNVGTLSLLGGVTVTGLAKRFVADFTNATLNNRLAFQTSTANSATVVGSMPSGTGTAAAFRSYSKSDATDSSYIGVTILGGSDARIDSGAAGAGTFLPLTLYTNALERLRIDTSGNVGIGTVTPAGLLHVLKDGASNNTFIDAYAAGSGASGSTIYRRANGTFALPTPVASGDRLGGVLGAGQSTTVSGAFVNSGGMFFEADENFTVAAAGTRVVWSTCGSGSVTRTEWMRLTMGGSLGLGTTTPNYAGYGKAITVESTTFGLFELASSIADGNNVVIGGLEANYRTNSATHNRIAGIQFVSDGATVNQRGGAVKFVTKSDGATGIIERMRISQGGRLGLGMTPTNFFDITSPTDDGIVMTDGTRTSFWKSFSAGPVGFGTSTAHNLALYTSGTARVTIDTSGNITALGVAVVKAKSADTSRNTTTVLADDPDLSMALLANTNYDIELLCVFLGTTSNVMGLKLQPNYTGTFAGSGYGAVLPDSAITTPSGTLNTTSSGGTVALAGGTEFFAKFGIRTVNAGTLSVQWAQNSSNANNLSLKAGSYLKVTKLS